ncbi:MAG TPA: sigma-70 family RNA polymerase sigma factor [Mycobacteriales bacterium]|nr:sigma-70 family RNA polymerase sigma factor [Mycobacteriales bacterium]
MTTVPPTSSGSGRAGEPHDADGPDDAGRQDDPGEGSSDAELITAVRSGHTDSYGVLYQRHVGAARRLARQIARSAAEADDLVADAFAKVLDTLRGGGGPDSSFRAYLLTALRNTLYDKTRRDRRLEFSDDMESLDPGQPFRDTALEGLEASLASRAFASLPERWQTVLWHTEIEGETPAQVAPLLGLTANGVSALAYRAREGLRQAYLQVHLADTAAEQCRYTVERLGAYARKGLSKRETSSVQAHLDTCERCSGLATELIDVNQGLRGVVAPLVIGAPWVAGYLAASAAKAAVGSAAVAAGTAAAAGAGTAASGGAAMGGAAKAGLAAKLFKTPSGQASVAATVAVVAAAALLLGLTNRKAPPPQPTPSQPVIAAPAPQSPTRPTTAAPTPPPTTPPTTPALVPSVTTGAITALGGLAAGRDGVIVLPVRNNGSSPAANVVADVMLSGGTMLRSVGDAGTGTGPRRFAVPQNFAGAQNSAGSRGLAGSQNLAVPAASAGTADDWSCRPGADGGRCTLGTLPAQAEVPLYLRVSVPAGVRSLRVSGTLSAPGGGPTPIAASTLPVAAAPADILPAYGDITRGTVVAIGNTVLSCPATDILFGATCQAARAGQPGLGLFCQTLCNDDWWLTPYAPSRAELVLPAGGSVLWAGLFWSGVDPHDTPGRDTVRLGMAGGPMTTVHASAMHTVDDAYQGYADVSTIVRDGGSWQVSGVVAKPGPGHYGGWSLVVVVHDSAQPRRQITVLDGLRKAGKAGKATVVAVPWLVAPHGTAQVSLVGWEGDLGLGGERITLDGAVVDEGDGLVGHADGAYYNRPGERGVQTFGVDTLSASAPLAGQASSRLVATAGRDQYLIGPVAVSAPVR